MNYVITVFCIVAQMFVSLAGADELPTEVKSKRNQQPLDVMPQRDKGLLLGTLKGFIQTVEGKPLAGGEAYFFNEKTGPAPAPEKYWRVPDAFAKLDDKGGYSIDLPPGSYYIGAIQRSGGKAAIGPPADGDMFYAGKNKYEVLPATQNSVDVVKGAKPFSRPALAQGEGVTAIEGSVFDTSGKPVENVMVFAHIQPAMYNKPLFVSEKTDRSGAFLLRVAGAGTYYLRVRNIYGGGMPEEGSSMGVYGGNNPKAVVVKDGDLIKGITIIEEKILRPSPRSR